MRSIRQVEHLRVSQEKIDVKKAASSQIKAGSIIGNDEGVPISPKD